MTIAFSLPFLTFDLCLYLIDLQRLACTQWRREEEDK